MNKYLAHQRGMVEVASQLLNRAGTIRKGQATGDIPPAPQRFAGRFPPRSTDCVRRGLWRDSMMYRANAWWILAAGTEHSRSGW